MVRPWWIVCIVLMLVAGSEAAWRTKHRMKPPEEIVQVRTDQGDKWAIGTGVLIKTPHQDRSFILTAEHLVTGAKVTGVMFPDGKFYLAIVEKKDVKHDIALLRIRKAHVTGRTLAGRDPRPGETIYLAGYGGKQGYHSVEAKNAPLYGHAIEADCNIESGTSGGPIINERGEVITVLSDSLRKERVDRQVCYNGMCYPKYTPWRTTGAPNSVARSLVPGVTRYHSHSGIGGRRVTDITTTTAPPTNMVPVRTYNQMVNQFNANFASQREDINKIKTEVTLMAANVQGVQMQEGPQGKQGERGEQGPKGDTGRAGKDADPARLAALEKRIEQLEKAGLYFEIYDENNRKLGPTRFKKLGETLRLGQSIID